MGSQLTFFKFERRPGGIPIGHWLTLYRNITDCGVFLGSVPIFSYDGSDRVAEATCMATLSRAQLAHDVDIARAFGVHRNTVARYVREFNDAGIEGLLRARPGPRGPSKVNASVVAVVEEHPDLGPRPLARLIADVTGIEISPTHVLRLKEKLRTPATGSTSAVQSRMALATSSGDTGTSGVLELEETVSDSVVEPAVVVPGEVRGVDMGAALFYPALSAVGLIDVANEHFRLPRSSLFGVRATVLSVFFLTLLGRPTLESGKHLARMSFGALIGTGIGPCVKTLRRKLAELVEQKSGVPFGEALARRWVESGIVASAYLYIDGHVKAYTGKRKLQEVWNAQRRMPLPGVMSYFVGDESGRPLLFITGEVANSLAKAMPAIVEGIRAVIGERSFTVIFDRGGYDGRLFTWLKNQGIDFITYQRGTPGLAVDQFKRREARFEGRRIRFLIAEDEVHVQQGGPWRRVVVYTPQDGHQTPILTSIDGAILGPARIACLMFARWRQENFFRYMRHRMGIDHLVSYAADEVRDARVPNPQRKHLRREVQDKRSQATELRKWIADDAQYTPLPASRAHLHEERKRTIEALRELESQLQILEVQLRACPSHLPAAELGETRHAMRLEQKILVDRIKVAAYNAEEWMLDLLRRHYRNPHDLRDLLRSFGRLPGVMTSTPYGLRVTLDSPDTPIHRRALAGLCEELNAIGPTYPGTRIPVSYAVAVHNST
jgi:hypothetical protein